MLVFREQELTIPAGKRPVNNLGGIAFGPDCLHSGADTSWRCSVLSSPSHENETWQVHWFTGDPCNSTITGQNCHSGLLSHQPNKQAKHWKITGNSNWRVLGIWGLDQIWISKKTMKWDKLNEPFLLGWCTWLGWPVGFCVQWIKISRQENIKDVIPSGISGRLPKELEGEVSVVIFFLIPKLPGNTIQTRTWLSSWAQKSCYNWFELDTALNMGLFNFCSRGWKAARGT